MQTDMKNRTVLVTGSTDGIGKETARQLARMGARVLLHGRDAEKGMRVREEICRSTGNDRLQFFVADLSSQKQARKMVADIRKSNDRLHVLINNAGTFEPERRVTEDGLEKTFAVNYLAQFLLSRELLDLMIRSAPARIVNVASIAHVNGTMDWSNLQGERRYEGFDAYAGSKLAVILFTYSLARRLNGTGVTVNCLHPGVIKTKLLRAGFGNFPGKTPEEGARTSAYLASSAEVEGISGKYFEECKAAQSSPRSYDQELQEELWRVSDELVELL